MKMQEETLEVQRQIAPLEWKPRPSTAGRKALATSSALALCSVSAWIYLLAQPVGATSILATLVGTIGAALALSAGAIAAAYYFMRYRLDNDRLTVSCLWMREIVPRSQIDGMYSGRRLGLKPQVRGLSLPGIYIGTVSGGEFGKPKFYGTTADPSSAVVVTAAHRAYAITPADLPGFRSQLVTQLEAAPKDGHVEAPGPVSEGTLIPAVPLLRDRICLIMLSAAVVVLVVSFAYVASKLGELPASIPLHFGTTGQPDMVVPKVDALRIPIIGMVILGVNWLVAAAVHAWQRDAGRMLVGATLFVELVTLMAILRVVH